MNELKKYGAIALDPIHIGAGGYRLGRVDNTIVRDPTTDVPKIPGTSLAGVIRAYADIVKKEEDGGNNNKKFKDVNIDEIFGTGDRQGVLRFYDAQILFFPVSSIQGTVWITTKELLEYWLGDLKDKNGEKLKIPEKIEDTAYIIKGIGASKPLNFGWLMLEIDNAIGDKEVTLPSQLNNFVKRIVAASDNLFSHIVNDNLEIRTSVKIDSKTGTAEKGALFTYEAIPRGTILGFEIVKDRRKGNKDMVEPLIEATFPYLKLIGVGGMGTRGFGRINVFNMVETSNDKGTQSGGK
ncbi:MAG: type III-B CRISPR module RAMP protein Cmr4 [Candidatus Methanoperedens sp.]